MQDVRQITVRGNNIGVVNLDKIMKEVYELNIKNEQEIKKKLLEKVKIYNYVAKNAENDYKDAIFEEYMKYFSGECNNDG